IQVQLEYAALVEDRLEHQRDQRFLRLAPIASLRREKQILRELLRDRRSAGNDASAPHVLVERLLDSVPVEAFMLDEFRVLRGDDGTLQLGRYPVVSNPLVGEPRAGTACMQLGESRRHER